jgi:hypothetical protein
MLTLSAANPDQYIHAGAVLVAGSNSGHDASALEQSPPFFVRLAPLLAFHLNPTALLA